MPEPYNDDIQKEMILRDHLAAARTVLANERTILAYLRTALATVAAGVGLVHFAATPAVRVIGLVLLVVGIAFLILGVFRFLSFRRHISALTGAGNNVNNG